MAKTRSPNYPAISLNEAIDKVKKIYKAEHLHPATDEVIAKALNYVSLNGRSMGVISAIKKYGLLVPEGDGYRVSDDAVDIIESPPESLDRIRAIEKAAFTPQLFAELHETYGKQLPSDSNLRHFLIKKKFNPNAADEVIKLYRDTLDLVTQLSPEYNAGEESEGIEQPATGGRPVSQRQPSLPRTAADTVSDYDRSAYQALRQEESQQDGQLHFPLYLLQGHKAALYAPASMSKKEFELLKVQINNSLAVMEVTSVINEIPTKAQAERPKKPILASDDDDLSDIFADNKGK